MTHGMTYKEMLEYVSDTPSCDNCIMSADPYSEACKNCDYIHETLLGLCEKADRYKVHDLRKDLNDLPPSEGLIITKATLNGRVIYAVDYNTKDLPSVVNYCIKNDDELKFIAWREIEPF